MTVGMSAGVILSEYLVAWIGKRGEAAMLGCMLGGMVWGMVASVAPYRLYFGLRKQAHESGKAQSLGAMENPR